MTRLRLFGPAALLLLLCSAAVVPPAHSEPDAVVSLPLRIEAVGDPSIAVPVTGGIPFPRGALASADQVRIVRGKDEVPAQVLRKAVWPDGSVKWVLVDLVVAPARAERLALEYGSEVTRRAVEKPLEVRKRGGGVDVSGPGLSARVGKDGSLAKLTVSGRSVIAGRGACLVLEALRVSGPEAFPGPSRVCHDASARAATGKIEIDSVEVESAGPIRGRVLLRGSFRVPHWGSDLPRRAVEGDPAGRVPFSLRFDFHRGLPLVTVAHQFVYTGEPDRDFVTRWGFEIPGQGAGVVRLVEEPGLTTDALGDEVARSEDRLCAADLKNGFALIRAGWENRPCLLGGERGDAARIDLWPREAGVFDLRRYAREWGIGETGERDRPEDIERYARYAARGMAKSHVFLMHFGGETGRDVKEALAEPALLVAPPGWYAASGALGVYQAEAAKGPYAPLEEGLRRYLDYFLFNQDLYRWHGKLAYGFWQTRNGDIHRGDRWDRDYGRWGWSLGDGAGRIGHVLMLEFLRTLERRYFRAGEAFNRAVYDTSMVHTRGHLENTRPSWWTVRGCNHRHGVQPFAGPYIGMRGSNPGGHRILYFLTGDGVIRDGLDLVSSVALEYATTRPGAFGGSGGSDGQGTGAMALLFAYETTGEDTYLDACRAILDKSGLFPPPDPSRLGYGPDFGLHLAAAEYADLTGDEVFVERLLATADAARNAKDMSRYLGVLAWAARQGEARHREALEQALAGLDFTGSLAELPVERWPGHGGWRHAPSRANVGRDLPYALGALEPPRLDGAWPRNVEDPVSVPACVPETWWRPGGAPKRAERLPDAKRLLGWKPPRRPPELPFPHPVPFVVLCRSDDAGNWRVARVLEKPDSGVRFQVRVVDGKAAGVRSKRVEMAVSARGGKERIAAWGVRIPFALGDDPKAVHVHAAGAFRVERWRVDQTDERIPGWLNSDSRTRWPRWRGGGLLLGPAASYRIFKLNREDTAPVYVDDGFASPSWLDVTDRGGDEHRGITVRMLPGRAQDAWRSVTFDEDAACLVLCFHAEAGSPLDPAEGPFSGAADVIVHDGWRPPLLEPGLSREQYRAFLDDLDHGPNIGLFALRFLLSETHQVRGDHYKDLLADRGVEPREILLSMQWRDALAEHCRRIGVRSDPDDPDATVKRVIEHYRRR